MRFLEINHGWIQPISNEESVVLELVKGNPDQLCMKKQMSLREQEVARQLCNRGILTRLKQDDNIYYGYQEPHKS